MPSITNAVNSLLGRRGNFEKLGKAVGVDKDKAELAVEAATPEIVGGLAAKSEGRGGVKAVNLIVDESDGSILDDLSGFFTTKTSDEGVATLAQIFGSDRSVLMEGLVGKTGLSEGIVEKVLPLLAPIVLAVIGARKAEDNLDQEGLVTFLTSERTTLQSGGFLSSPSTKGAASGAAGFAAVKKMKSKSAKSVNFTSESAKGKAGPMNENAKDKAESMKDKAAAAKDAADDVKGKAGDLADGAKDKAAGLKSKAGGLKGKAGGLKGKAGGLKGKAGDLTGDVKGKAGGLVDGAKDKAGDVAGKAGDVAGDAKGKAGDLKGKAGDVAGGVKGKAGDLKGKAGDVAGGVKGKAGDLKGKAGDVAGDAKGKAGDVAGGVKGKAGDLKGKAGDPIGDAKGKAGDAIGDAKGKAGSVAGGIKGVSGDVVGDVKGKTGSLKGRSSAVKGQSLAAADRVGATTKSTKIEAPAGPSPKSWIGYVIGIIAVIAALGLIATQCSSDDSEVVDVPNTVVSDLQAAVDGELPDGVTASIDGDEVTLTGDVSSSNERSTLVSTVEGIDGVGSVVDELTLGEDVETDPASDLQSAVDASLPEGVVATLDGDTVTLTGDVATSEDASALVATVSEIEGVGSVDDQLTVADAETADGEAEGETTLDEELDLGDITFEYTAASLTAEGQSVVDEWVTYLADNPDVSVLIVGHTDSDGEEADNLALSQRRAETVKVALEAAGIDGARMETEGKGELEPKVENDTDANKAINRRIEFIQQ